MRMFSGSHLLLASLLAAVAASADPAKFPDRPVQPVAPDILPTPVPGPANALTGGDWYVVQSDDDVQLLASPPGVVTVTEEVGSIRLLNVRPNPSFQDAANRTLADAVLSSELIPRNATGGAFDADLPDMFGRQRGLVVPLTESCRSVFHRVGTVGGIGVPPQIADVVVRRVAVTVAAHQTFGCGTGKCFQHQPMNVAGDAAVISLQSNGNVPVFVRVSSQASPIPANHRTRTTATPFAPRTGDTAGPYGAIISGAVAGESGNVLVGDDRISRSHDVPSYPGWLWSGSAGVDSTRSTRFILADQPSIRIPKPVVIPDVMPPAPTPGGAVSLRKKELYVVESDTELVVLCYPRGLVEFKKKKPGTFYGEFAGGNGVWEERELKGPYVYVGEAKCTGRAELSFVPLGLKSESDIVYATVDVTDGTDPIPPPKPVDPVKPAPVKSFRVIFVVESGATLTAAQNSVVYGVEVEEFLTANCTGGRAGWLRRDKDATVDRASEVMKALWAAVKPSLTGVPSLVIEWNGHAEILPLEATPAAQIAKFKSYLGGK